MLVRVATDRLAYYNWVFIHFLLCYSFTIPTDNTCACRHEITYLQRHTQWQPTLHVSFVHDFNFKYKKT